MGSAFGSFLNVVVDRMMKGAKITGRSYCDHCRKVLSPYDLVPVLSFLYLGGRCRYCGRKLSWQYPAVELLCGGLFTLSFWYLAAADKLFVALPFYFLLVFVMVAVSVVDIKYSLIPTTFIYFTSLVALIYQYFMLDSQQFVNYVIAAFAASLFFMIIVVLTRGRGMGIGDAVLAFLMGLVLGPGNVVLAIFLAFFLGASVATVLLSVGRKRFGQTIPFGPFLVLGFFISLFWGQLILSWYWGAL